MSERPLGRRALRRKALGAGQRYREENTRQPRDEAQTPLSLWAWAWPWESDTLPAVTLNVLLDDKRATAWRDSREHFAGCILVAGTSHLDRDALGLVADYSAPMRWRDVPFERQSAWLWDDQRAALVDGLACCITPNGRPLRPVQVAQCEEVVRRLVGRYLVRSRSERDRAPGDPRKTTLPWDTAINCVQGLDRKVLEACPDLIPPAGGTWLISVASGELGGLHASRAPWSVTLLARALPGDACPFERVFGVDFMCD